jgi:uncharacterized DUF497 family protein
MSLRVEWDQGKAEANLLKHAVSFEEAATVLGDPLSAVVGDPDHSSSEERLLVLGQSSAGRFLLLSITERAEAVRIISAREMTPGERRSYERSVRT